MKKFRGTKFAHIGTTYTPTLEAEIAKVGAAVLNQQARLHEIALRVAEVSGDIDLAHFGE